MMCTNGIVASEHPLASQAGVDILKSGGNAVDAAITVNSVLNVVEPASCGMGGDIFYLIYDASEDKVSFLNGSGRAGASVSIDSYKERGLASIPRSGPLAAITVPGCVDGWVTVLEKYGTKNMRELLGPAIEYADEGFPISHTVSGLIKSAAERYSAQPEWNRIFMPRGRVMEPGDILVQKDLANSFRTVSDGGRHSFYEGIVSDTITEFLGKRGGMLSPEDFAHHSSTWGEPLSVDYRGYTVYETAPNSQGLAALIALNLMEEFDIPSLGHHSIDHLHLMIEASMVAYEDRDRYVTDPEFVDIPVVRLLSKNYSSERSERIRIDRALKFPRSPRSLSDHKEGDTTYFAVVDKDRNCVSCIQSLYNTFGSGIVAGETGIVLQNRGSYFSLDSLHHNRLEPNKRTFHTLMASMTLRDGQPFLVFGSMGADVQPQIHVQAFSSVFDFKMDIQEVIEAPRWSIPKSIYSTTDTVLLESRFPQDVAEGLKGKGHDVEFMPAYYWYSGFAHGVLIKDDILMGGADPRGDGVALGY